MCVCVCVCFFFFFFFFFQKKIQKLCSQRPGSDGALIGHALFDLSELAYDVEYMTERGSIVKRVSDSELVLSKSFRLPVFPMSAETLMECEIFPSTARVLLELHAQRKMGSRNGHPNGGGILLFDEKRIARFITQIDDLCKGVSYSSSNNEIVVERLEHNGRVQIKIRQSPGLALLSLFYLYFYFLFYFYFYFHFFFFEF